MKKIKRVYYEWRISDNFGHTEDYDNKREAQRMEKYYAKQRKVLDFIKPKGITLVLSKDTDYWAKCIPAFIGWNGVPFCQSNKDKDRDFFMSLHIFVEDGMTICGNLRDIIKRAYAFMDGRGRHSFSRWRGAYHDRWDATYGNDAALPHVDAWTKGALWYNWDGENFTTNDKRCSLTSEDFK